MTGVGVSLTLLGVLSGCVQVIPETIYLSVYNDRIDVAEFLSLLAADVEMLIPGGARFAWTRGSARVVREELR